MERKHLTRRQFTLAASGLLLATQAGESAFAQQGNVPIPGTGLWIEQASDDFEDPEWGYIPNAPKSSDENDKRQRLPAGRSKNNRWFEPVMRGQPDVVKRIEPPSGGLEASTGAMYMASIYPGIPGAPSGKVEQDDFVANVTAVLGSTSPIAWQPNCLVRVFVPPVEQWERRNGASFGYRVGLRASHKKEGRNEEYWPGMLLRMETRMVESQPQRYIQLTVRANDRGHDVNGPVIAEPGWYTLGMSMTANGAVHYFFRPGVGDFVASDRIASYFPYGYRALYFETYFFDVLTRDNGRTWSTPWVVDDAMLYLASPPRNFPSRR